MNRRSSSVINWRNRTKQKLVEYKGGACEICGYNKPIWSVYEFHHVNPKEKDFAISGKSWSFERLRSEVDKCRLLCGNCHSEVHWELQQTTRLDRQTLKKCRLPTKQCDGCKLNFRPKKNSQHYCSMKCAKISQRKVVRPTKKELNELLKINSFTKVGQLFGVSDNTIRKWLA